MSRTSKRTQAPRALPADALRGRLARNLKRHRRAAGLTQKEASARVGLDRHHGNKIEHGESNVTSSRRASTDRTIVETAIDDATDEDLRAFAARVARRM